jgi:mutator protein MutT
MAQVEQLALFDVASQRIRRFRRSQADNAMKRSRGRMVVAGGIIVDALGRVLLLHRATDACTWWETPGGKVDPGEGPREAAIRELGEELGVVASVINDLGWHDLRGSSQSVRYALYLMQIDAGDPRPVERESFDDAQFFTWAQVMAMRDILSPNAQNVVEMLAKGRLQLLTNQAAPHEQNRCVALTLKQGRNTIADFDTHADQLCLDAGSDVQHAGRLRLYVSTAAGLPADRAERWARAGSEELAEARAAEPVRPRPVL